MKSIENHASKSPKFGKIIAIPRLDNAMHAKQSPMPVSGTPMQGKKTRNRVPGPGDLVNNPCTRCNSIVFSYFDGRNS